MYVQLINMHTWGLNVGNKKGDRMEYTINNNKYKIVCEGSYATETKRGRKVKSKDYRVLLSEENEVALYQRWCGSGYITIWIEHGSYNKED